jgi:hypothetical protein
MSGQNFIGPLVLTCATGGWVVPAQKLAWLGQTSAAVPFSVPAIDYSQARTQMVIGKAGPLHRPRTQRGCRVHSGIVIRLRH